MKLLIIDPGHGGGDPGAVYKDNYEKKYNLELAKKIEAYLKNNYEVTVQLTRNSDADVSLDVRTDYANKEKADFYLSIHQNSGGGEGFESYVYNGVCSETKAIQNAIHAETAKVMQKYKVRNRGEKQANFHVLRETKMPAVLLEVVFIDNEQNMALLKRSDFQDEAAKAIAVGTAKALSLTEVSKVLYAVIVGAFEEKKNAEDRVSILAEKKISAFIDKVKIGSKTYYRVQTGAYGRRKNAEDQVLRIRSSGIKDAYVMVKGEEAQNPVPEPPKPDPKPERIPEPPKGLTIRGQSLLTADEMERFVRKVNPNAPTLADYYIEIGQVYGIRADTAYAQAVHETGYFRFQGSVKASQNNFAGIGATGKGESAVFKSPKEGVLAHIQHLFAYSSLEPAPAQFRIVDPRFQLIQRGSAAAWNQLNGTWAVPGTNYSMMILDIYRKMLADTKVPLEQRIEVIKNRIKEI